MARSSYIYIILPTEEGRLPLAAFTVKYECKRVTDMLTSTFIVRRYKDGVGVGDGVNVTEDFTNGST